MRKFPTDTRSVMILLHFAYWQLLQPTDQRPDEPIRRPATAGHDALTASPAPKRRSGNRLLATSALRRQFRVVDSRSDHTGFTWLYSAIGLIVSRRAWRQPAPPPDPPSPPPQPGGHSHHCRRSPMPDGCCCAASATRHRPAAVTREPAAAGAPAPGR